MIKQNRSFSNITKWSTEEKTRVSTIHRLVPNTNKVSLSFTHCLSINISWSWSEVHFCLNQMGGILKIGQIGVCLIFHLFPPLPKIS